MQIDSPVGQRWKVKRDALDERQRRLWVGIEAKVLGRGGIAAAIVVRETPVATATAEIPPRPKTLAFYANP